MAEWRIRVNLIKEAARYFHRVSCVYIWNNHNIEIEFHQICRSLSLPTRDVTDVCSTVADNNALSWENKNSHSFWNTWHSRFHICLFKKPQMNWSILFVLFLLLILIISKQVMNRLAYRYLAKRWMVIRYQMKSPLHTKSLSSPLNRLKRSFRYRDIWTLGELNIDSTMHHTIVTVPKCRWHKVFAHKLLHSKAFR